MLPLLKDYVQLFQSHAPLIHKLHDEIEALSRAFLGCFIRAESLEGVQGKKLKNFKVTDTKVRLPVDYNVF